MSVILQRNGQVHFSSIKVLDFHVKVVLFYIWKFGEHLQSSVADATLGRNQDQN